MRSESERARERLVRELEAAGSLRDARITAAFMTIPREEFVPEFADDHGIADVYRDEVIPTKVDSAGTPVSSSSQPTIMAQMLERLDIREGDRVLEIGAGTGYNAALLGSLVGDGGRVVSIEIEPALAKRARAATRQWKHVEVVSGDGRKGWPRSAPYDRITATASIGEIPPGWVEQLRDGGLLQVPLHLRGALFPQAIVTLQRDGQRLRSVSVVLGGFMGIRSTADEAGPHPPTVAAYELTEGRRRPLVSVSGKGISGLSERSRQRLLAVALGEGRRRAMPVRARREAIVLYVCLTAPLNRLVIDGNGRVGLMSAGGSGLAVLGGSAVIDRIHSFGDRSSEESLAALVREWDKRGRPDEGDLDVELALRKGHWVVRHRWTSSSARGR